MTKEVDNSVAGFRELRDLARKARATVCVEPTGGYELELVAFMHRFDVPVAYADALRVRQFAKAEGNLSKNDTIDAALISRFADKICVRVLGAQDVEAVELKRKARFRQTMVDSRTAMANRLETETDPERKALLKEQIRHMNRLVDKAERLCLDTVGKNERMNSLRKRFTRVGGVGDLTAMSILAELPEIGTLPDGKLNRLVGIAPEEKQSGTKEWTRRIWGGRKDVRNALYIDQAECQRRTEEENCVAFVPGRRFPFPSSFSPAPPHPPCFLIPCAGAQGLESAHLYNARKFHMKFTVAVPSDLYPCNGRDVRCPSWRCRQTPQADVVYYPP